MALAAADDNEHQVASNRCCLLEIAAELRNSIYEYAFTSDDDPCATELLKAKPPSDALARTCRQIHGEANGIWRHARRQYWSTSNFIIDHISCDRIVETLGQNPSLDTLDTGAVHDSCLRSINRVQVNDLVRGVQMTLGSDTWTWYGSDGIQLFFLPSSVDPWALPDDVQAVMHSCEDRRGQEWWFIDACALDEGVLQELRKTAKRYTLSQHELIGVLIFATSITR